MESNPILNMGGLSRKMRLPDSTLRLQFGLKYLGTPDLGCVYYRQLC